MTKDMAIGLLLGTMEMAAVTMVTDAFSARQAAKNNMLEVIKRVEDELEDD